ncbi:hypothetical protein GEMRC1_012881 [Eukaryota sp. GEM-RC1]
MEILRPGSGVIITRLIKELGTSLEQAENNLSSAKVLQSKLTDLTVKNVEDLHDFIPYFFYNLFLTWRHTQLIENPDSSSTLISNICQYLIFKLVDYLQEGDTFGSLLDHINLSFGARTEISSDLYTFCQSLKDKILSILRILSLVRTSYISCRTKTLSEASKFAWKPVSQVLNHLEVFAERISDLLDVSSVLVALSCLEISRNTICQQKV